MIVIDVCPFCGEEKIEPPIHYPSPEGERCPATPMTRSASTPSPPGVEGTEREGSRQQAGCSVLRKHDPAEGRDAADPATTL